MKKTIALLLALMIMLSAAYAFAQNQNDAAQEIAEEIVLIEEPVEEPTEELSDTLDEEEAEIYDITGMITDLTDEYIAIENVELGEVHVLMTEDTIIEGAEALEIGQTIVVMYNGMMTRSLPPQITALHIGVYGISGVIAEIGEETVTIVRGDTGEEVVLTLDEMLMESFLELELAEDDEIIAYTTGLMTMSLPPIMNAVSILPAMAATPDEASKALEEAIPETQEIEEIEADLIMMDGMETEEAIEE